MIVLQSYQGASAIRPLRKIVLIVIQSFILCDLLHHPVFPVHEFVGKSSQYPISQPKGSMCLCSLYLGVNVHIWEPLQGLSIYCLGP